MTDPVVSDEAVEAAIEAAIVTEPWATEDDIRRAFRAALAAAAPLLAADAITAERERIAQAIEAEAAIWDHPNSVGLRVGLGKAAEIARAGGTR